MRRVCLAIVVLVVTVATASAQENCDADQASMNQCAGDALDAADAELNADYKEIMARLGNDAKAKNLFKVSQRAWIAFRDAECVFKALGVEGGTIYPTIHMGCLEALTNARIADFDTYLNCQEGDFTCPAPEH